MNQPKIGDVISCDCGYDGMIEMRDCEVIGRPTKCVGLFDDSPDYLRIPVIILGTGEMFHTCVDLP